MTASARHSLPATVFHEKGAGQTEVRAEANARPFPLRQHAQLIGDTRRECAIGWHIGVGEAAQHDAHATRGAMPATIAASIHHTRIRQSISCKSKGKANVENCVVVPKAEKNPKRKRGPTPRLAWNERQSRGVGPRLRFGFFSSLNVAGNRRASHF